MRRQIHPYCSVLFTFVIAGCPPGGGETTGSTGTGEITDGTTSGGETVGSTDVPTESTAPTTGGAGAACRDEPDAPVFEHEAGDVGTETWPSGVHVLGGSIHVGGLLTVEPCSVIKVPDGASIAVADGGAVHWVGTAEDPIIVTSAKSSGMPGDWVEIDIHADSTGPENVLRHVVIEHGGGGSYGALWVETGASIELSDCTIRNSGDFGLVVAEDAELRNFVGNTLQDNASGALKIAPDGVGQLGAGTYAPNAVEGIHVTSGAVRTSQTWLTHDAPYVAAQGFSVETEAGSAQLTVEPGAVIKLGDGATLTVGNNGGLTLVGTAEQPITITSSKTSGAPGDWVEIDVHAASADEFNRFEYVIVEHGGGGNYGQVWVEEGASIAITNSTIRSGDDVGISNHGELRDFTGNTIVDNAAGALRIDADAVDQLQPGTYGPNPVDGIIIEAEAVSHDATWQALGVPFLAPNGFSVGVQAGSARLVLDPGVDLRLGEGATLSVDNNGALRLDGTADNPVRLGSAKPAPAPGDWLEIDINDGSVGPENVFTYAEIAHGGAGNYGQLYVATNAEVTLDHVSFSDAGEGCDVYANGVVNAISTDYVPCP
ncbi:hypothetical protein [Nannocystis pusilla]|uniref:Right handed beta helix domain-containing protein n=1 Tax=Nannocystis pusilla TaxID=889268 RepID=A0ABS7TII9_9BACT|nr:hypothetical protein [Nannocystis pusilla]MBZ5707927.1 hypothetical protein [Nannocystis pusilla]